MSQLVDVQLAQYQADPIIPLSRLALLVATSSMVAKFFTGDRFAHFASVDAGITQSFAYGAAYNVSWAVKHRGL